MKDEQQDNKLGMGRMEWGGHEMALGGGVWARRVPGTNTRRKRRWVRDRRKRSGGEVERLRNSQRSSVVGPRRRKLRMRGRRRGYSQCGCCREWRVLIWLKLGVRLVRWAETPSDWPIEAVLLADTTYWYHCLRAGEYFWAQPWRAGDVSISAAWGPYRSPMVSGNARA